MSAATDAGLSRLWARASLPRAGRAVVVGPVPDAEVRRLFREIRDWETAPPDLPWPWQDASVDLVVAAGLEAEPDALVAEIQRVLRPGAALLALAPARARALRGRLRHYYDVDPAKWKEGVLARRRARGDVSGHFENLAPHYDGQIPPHLRAHYLGKKLAAFDRALDPTRRPAWGLDVGCGTAAYARAVADRFGTRVAAVDASRPSVRLAARAPRVRLAAADGLRLPFRDGAFDFAYTVNLVHHLKRGEQERFLREVARVLRPGAPFLVFEINTRNALFGWYMRHVFPRTRRIDRGDEEFVHPGRLPLGPDFRLERIEYSTFTPDFVPPWASRAFAGLEHLLERSPLSRYGIHYVALLRKPPRPERPAPHAAPPDRVAPTG